MAEYQTITHTFEPIYDKKSKVLILGTLPSVKSGNRTFIMDIQETDSGN